MNNLNTHLDWYPRASRSRVSRPIFSVLVTFTVAVLSIAIARENWLLLAGGVAIPLLFLWPVQMSLGIFAFLLPFDSVAILGATTTGTTLNWISGALTAVILFGMGVVSGRLEKPPQAAIWWVLFMTWSAATVLWALEPDKALRRLPTAFALLFLYVVAVSFRMSRKELSGVVVLTILGGLTAATFSFHQFLNSGGSLRSSLAMAGRETDPNQFAASLLLPLSLAMGAFFTSRGWLNRLSATAALALIGFGILLSMSRGSVLAVAVMIGVYLYRGGMNRRTILPIAVIALLLLAVPSLFFVRIQQGAEDKGEGRLDIWQVGLVAVEHNGVFGAGLDSFPALYQKYAGNSPIFRGYRRGPHNIYLSITAEMGIIGLLLFLAAVRSQLRFARHGRPAEPDIFFTLVACEAASYGMLTAAFFLDVLWRKTFWMSFILLALACRQSQITYLDERH
jgi:O-antigen ligase